jgi:mono/diheme cytochrome c family protein
LTERPTRPSGRRARRYRAAVLIAAALAVAGPGCGGGGDGDAAGSQASRTPSATRGKRLVEQRGCLSCHTTDGRRWVGPTWKGLAGSQVRLVDGRTVTADEEYLRRSIRDPDADIVEGFKAGVMGGAMPGRPLTGAEIDDIVAYLQSL